jgi:Flp pilus assembly pilin Flp
MKRFNEIVLRFVVDRSGSGAVEYGLMAAAIGLAIFGSGAGNNLGAKFAAINALLR